MMANSQAQSKNAMGAQSIGSTELIVEPNAMDVAHTFNYSIILLYHYVIHTHTLNTS